MRFYTAVGVVVPGLVLCSVLVGGGCTRTNRAVALSAGYRVTMPEASQTLRMRPLPLTVRVTDAAGAPVDEVPVQFRMPQAPPAVAVIEPPTVVTRDGKATAIFRSRAEGRFEIEISVEEYTETVHVTVFGDTPRF